MSKTPYCWRIALLSYSTFIGPYNHLPITCCQTPVYLRPFQPLLSMFICWSYCTVLHFRMLSSWRWRWIVRWLISRSLNWLPISVWEKWVSTFKSYKSIFSEFTQLVLFGLVNCLTFVDIQDPTFVWSGLHLSCSIQMRSVSLSFSRGRWRCGRNFVHKIKIISPTSINSCPTGS